MPKATVARTATCQDCKRDYEYWTNPGQRCPKCRKKRKRRTTQDWKATNRDRVSASYRRSKARDPEKFRARSYAYYESHRAESNAASAAYRKANPKKRSATLARSQAKHKEKRLAANRAYYAANRERWRQWKRAWRKANPDKVRATQQKRYALKQGAAIGPSFTNLDIANRDGWRCHLCGRRVTRKNWSIDHLIPLSKGGAHSKENVALAHRLCNVKRNVWGPAQLRLLD